MTDYPKAIEDCLARLKEAGHIRNESELAAVGFKTIMAEGVNGCVRLDESVVQAMEAFSCIAPAHNPPYITGIRLFARRMPSVPLIGLFETAFYQWAPEAAVRYAVPEAWHDWRAPLGLSRRQPQVHCRTSAQNCSGARTWPSARGSFTWMAARIRRGSLDSASFPVISAAVRPSRGSSTAWRSATSMGMSPQSGLPQNNRVGRSRSIRPAVSDARNGHHARRGRKAHCKESGLKGLSGAPTTSATSKRAPQGNARAQLALDVFVHQVRHWIGSFFLELNGADALVFTAGIGENHVSVRRAVCDTSIGLGIVLDAERNAAIPRCGRKPSSARRIRA